MEWYKIEEIRSDDIPHTKVCIYDGNIHFGWLAKIEITRQGREVIFNGDKGNQIKNPTHIMFIRKPIEP